MKDLFHRAKIRAAEKKIKFSITKEWIMEKLENGKCEATGLPFSYDRPAKSKTQHPYSPSIDRKDSSRGYTPDNCHMVVFAYNVMKSQYDEELILTISDAIRKSRRKNKS